MVECEYNSEKALEVINNVLIDTWWNVNVHDNLLRLCRDLRFNRYMVECE